MTTPSAATVIALAKTQIGVHEGHDSSGWNNDQKYSDETPGFDWSDGQPWCDTFVAWCSWKSGFTEDQWPRSASCDASGAAFKQMGRWSEYPAIGAQVFFGTSSDLQHTGIVTKYDDTYIWTVEGNTNSSGSYQGDGVYAKMHARRDSRLIGYGYPKFPEGITSADPKWQRDPKPEPTPDPVPERETERIPVAHVSMQYSDTFDQMTSDAERIFKRAADGDIGWVTGTEAGEEPLRSILRDAADAAGFRFYANRGQWIAVDRGLIKGNWDTGYVPVLESTEGRGKHTDRGITWASFDTAKLGKVTIGCGHYLTDGREPNDPNYRLNLEYAATIGKWGQAAGSDTALVFYHGDQNINDATDDTFRGQPFTSAQDELGRHESTGHGPIDVIASYNKDVRVKAVDVRVLDDGEFRLNTDHFFVVAVFEIWVLS